MSQGIISLILENKKRFYKGELRNRYFETNLKLEVNSGTKITSSKTDENHVFTGWDNLKNLGKRISNELFYEGLN
ncbi:MAG: hypothetical protein V1783_11865 [Bacteroidota bacterium]|jgi:hypothetical protein